RPGEKLHETLVSEDESRQAVEYDDMFVLEPLYPSWEFSRREGWKGLAAGFRYSSDTNDVFLDKGTLLEMVGVANAGDAGPPRRRPGPQDAAALRAADRGGG